MIQALKSFEHAEPEIVFHWQDSETDAQGWVVINSLRNGAAGGGTRMRKGCTLDEVRALSKTMEIKFAVSGPPIGGAKSGIDFDPNDPRKDQVLRRWYKAVRPLLKHYYGTGGDLNVDEVHDVMPITESLGIAHPQEGVVRGFFNPDPDSFDLIIEQLQGVRKRVTHFDYAPTTKDKVITVSDMITGYGVGKAVVHGFDVWGVDPGQKRVIIQGFGNVGGAAALTLAHHGFKIVGIIDRRGGLIRQEGLTLPEVKKLYLNREQNQLPLDEIRPFEEIQEKIWTCGAEVFIPAAGSRLITQHQVDQMLANDLKLISSGANVPFADEEIFLGPIGMYADERLLVIPDFIANCGMARAFAYFMRTHVSMEDEDIFEDISQTIYRALHKTYLHHDAPVNVWKTALSWVLEELNSTELEHAV
ncbi:MAG: Glu/Leu/Phe/Val dehydrogenase dimerization domain-containing protein [Bacteroidota bacterium]